MDIRADIQSGIRADATKLPFKDSSVGEIVASNPFIPKSAGGTNSMMDFLPEATRAKSGKPTERKPSGGRRLESSDNEHYSSVKNKSQFTVPQEELRQVLQSKEVVSTPVTRILPSADGPRYVCEVDLGRNIGTDKFNNFSNTTKMTVLTDRAGNLVSAFPGVLK